MSGTAAARGLRWAESVARRAPKLLAKPWPELGGRCARIAASKVDDLSSDERALAALVRELDEAARRRWANLQAERRQ